MRSLLDRTGDLLQCFANHVSAEEAKETGVTPQNTVSSDRTRMKLWNQRVKPIRALSTIDLDAQIKANLVSDLDRFLSPNRAKWYSERGIPYKPGLLLQGPPGTGKSSISLALAGHLGGLLYTIALGEVRDEAHLKKLFKNPAHGACVLLEDIDCAGIGREMKSKDKSESADAGNGKSEQKSSNSSVSLSGLLNAIDALADGVVLIMTTNEPEALDSALIRPGRIDNQIHVGYASQAVTESIFKRFYGEHNQEQDVSTDSDVRISELASQFASKIPDLKLTPAEIQGFLIPLSDSPETALAPADKWISDLLAAKVAGKNIVG